MQITIPSLSRKQWLKIFGAVVVLGLLAWNAYGIQQRNKLMWQYLTQTLEMSDKSTPTRAQLLDVLLVERFSPKKEEKKEPAPLEVPAPKK